MNTNLNNSELNNRIALTSGNKTILPPELTQTEKRIVDRLLMFSQQQADIAAADGDGLASFHDGISFGYWASARAICEERKLSLEQTERICGAKPPTATKKGN
jgi:hypothetical protein